MSKLWFRYGAMNCGKSTRLMQDAHNYEERGMKVSVIKHSKDKKAGDMLESRIGLKRKVDYLVTPEDDMISYLASIYKNGVACILGLIFNFIDIIYDIISKHRTKYNLDCILVDEAQFLTKKQIDTLYVFAKQYDIPIMCYGLRVDFLGELFPGSERLFAIADELVELQTICSCGHQARFNARLNKNGEYVTKGSQVAIDGIDATYESMCGDCFLKKVLKKKLILD